MKASRRQGRAAIVAGAVAAVLLVGGIVYYLVSPIGLPWQRAEAHLATSAELGAGIVHLNGTTDLPDGARIDLVFVRESEIQDVRHIGNPSHLLRARVEVRNGTFSHDADLHDWPPGLVASIATFAVGPDHSQPPQIVSRFGSQGERLAGPQVDPASPGEIYFVTRVQLGS